MLAIVLGGLCGSAPLFDARAPLAAEAVSFGDCERCHARAAKSHAASMHARASDNAVYLAGFKREPMQWCENCHHPARASAEAGVGCLTCHVRDGRVLSPREPTAAAEQAHPFRVEPLLRTAAFCGACHQFAFPVGKREPVSYSTHPMQNTLAEWREHGSDTTCQGCHMAEGSHAMAGGHDAELLRKSVSVLVERRGAEVRLSLASRGAAHRVPTGDPFRRLRFTLCSDRACTVVRRELELGRDVIPTGNTWRVARDDTLPSRGARHFDLEAPADAQWWRLALRYAAKSSEPLLEPDDREALIAAGAVGSPSP